MDCVTVLKNEDLSCVITNGETTYKSKKAGVAPLCEFIERGVNARGFSAADKVVGRAAALLFAKLGVASVYALVISKGAKKVLENHKIKYLFDAEVASIKNKSGTGVCPMEKAVMKTDDPNEAYRILKEKTARKLGFGLMRVPIDDTEACNKMVDAFLENGFDYFDTAYVYHNEKGEDLAKRCLVARHPRESFRLATKLPVWLLKTAADNERFFNIQLENCGVEYFDYYLLHNINRARYQTVLDFKSFEFGFAKKAEGKIKNFGFSMHDSADLLEEILIKYPNVDFVQLQINYLDMENPSIQSRKCMEICNKHNIPIIVMEPVKGGQLANVPESAEKLMRAVNPTASPASWAIRYAADLPGVFTVLSGMTTMENLTDNMSFMKTLKPLTKTEHKVIKLARSIIEGDIAIGCTACEYCVKGCPKNIAIPNYFALYNEKKRAGEKAFVPKMYYENISAGRGKASDCIACGLCEKVCPQKLKIIDGLRDITALFEDKKEEN
jgi:predicted aldo/keto reductase-like oxidoreductase